MAKPRRVARPKEFTEQIAFLVKEGTAERIDAVRGDMKKADFLRNAVDTAIIKAGRKKARD